jgi:hypothetical protein
MTHYVHCIHGMIWKTCQLCRQKTESDVEADLRLQKQEQNDKLLYDYQETIQSGDENDSDFAYDMEDMGM